MYKQANECSFVTFRWKRAIINKLCCHCKMHITYWVVVVVVVVVLVVLVVVVVVIVITVSKIDIGVTNRL